MSTVDFVSTSADGIWQADEPLISVTTILANLGSHPAITVPVIAGDVPDVNWVWDYLKEPADFFGIAMLARDDLRVACQRFAASVATGTRHSLLAVTILLIEANGRVQFVVTGVPGRQFDPTPVRIAVTSDVSWPVCHPTDAMWQRMAARTTSRGDVDQLARWLNGNGFVDLVGSDGASSSGPPALGALVFDHRDRLIGLDNPWPVSVLGLMGRCGATRAGMITAPTDFVDPEQASFAWWVSPLFEVHPVERIGEMRYEVDTAMPPTFLGRMP
jgi:hypothetical protein